MFQIVAVEDVFTFRQIEPHQQPHGFSGIDQHGVFPSGIFGRHSCGTHALQHPEMHTMHMERMIRHRQITDPNTHTIT